MKNLLPLMCLSLHASFVAAFSSSAAPRGAATRAEGHASSPVIGSFRKAMARGSPLWALQMPDGSNPRGDAYHDNSDDDIDPTMSMLQRNQMRAKRLMTQGRLIREQIDESPFKMSFIWLSDQLIGLTSHLRDRYEVLQYYALRREEDRMRLTRRNIELFEWVEGELAEVESQLEDYGRLVASTLRANPNDGALQEELRQLSMLSQDMQTHLSEQLPHGNDRKYQELKQEYEKAQSSLGRLNQLRHELYAVEEALDEMEGPLFMDAENDENRVASPQPKKASTSSPPAGFPSSRRAAQKSEPEPILAQLTGRMANTWDGLTTFPYERAQPPRGGDGKVVGNGADDAWRGPYGEQEQESYNRQSSVSKSQEYKQKESWDGFVKFWDDFTSPQNDIGKPSADESTGQPRESRQDTQLPNHYEAVAEWASKQPGRTSVEQVMFQLRNQRVAMETQSSGSSTRWGDMEVARAVAFAEMVWDTLDTKFPESIASESVTSEPEGSAGSPQGKEKDTWSPQKGTNAFSTFAANTSTDVKGLSKRGDSEASESVNADTPWTPQAFFPGLLSKAKGDTAGTMSRPSANHQQQSDTGNGWSPRKSDVAKMKNTDPEQRSSFQTSTKPAMDTSPNSFSRTYQEGVSGASRTFDDNLNQSFSTATPNVSSPKASISGKSLTPVRKIKIDFSRKGANLSSSKTQASDTSSRTKETGGTPSKFRPRVEWKTPGNPPPRVTRKDSYSSQKSDETAKSSADSISWSSFGAPASDREKKPAWARPWASEKSKNTESSGVPSNTESEQKTSEVSSNTEGRPPWNSFSSSPSLPNQKDAWSPPRSSETVVSAGDIMPPTEEASTFRETDNESGPPAFNTPWNSSGNQPKMEKEDAWSPGSATAENKEPWSPQKTKQDRQPPTAGVPSDSWSPQQTTEAPANKNDNAPWNSVGTPPPKVGSTGAWSPEKGGDTTQKTIFDTPWKSSGTSPSQAERKVPWGPLGKTEASKATVSSMPWDSPGIQPSRLEKEEAWSSPKSDEAPKDTDSRNARTTSPGTSLPQDEKKAAWSPTKNVGPSKTAASNMPWSAPGMPPSRAERKDAWSPLTSDGPPKESDPVKDPLNTSPSLVQKKPENTESRKMTAPSMPYSSSAAKSQKAENKDTWSRHKADEPLKDIGGSTPWNPLATAQPNSLKKDAWSPTRNTVPSSDARASTPWSQKDSRASADWKSFGTSSKDETEQINPHVSGDELATPPRDSFPSTPNNAPLSNAGKSSGTTQNQTPWSSEKSEEGEISSDTGAAFDDTLRGSQRPKVEEKAAWSPRKTTDRAAYFKDTAWSTPGVISSAQTGVGWSPQRPKEDSTTAPWNSSRNPSSEQAQVASRGTSAGPWTSAKVRNNAAWASPKNAASTSQENSMPWSSQGASKPRQEQKTTWQPPKTKNEPGANGGSSKSPGINPNFGMRTRELGAEEIDVYGPVANQNTRSSRDARSSGAASPRFEVKTTWTPQNSVLPSTAKTGSSKAVGDTSSPPGEKRQSWSPQKNSLASSSVPRNDIGPPNFKKGASTTEAATWGSSDSSSAKDNGDFVSKAPKKTADENKGRSPGIVEGFGQFTRELGMNGGVLDSSYLDMAPPEKDLSSSSPGINPNFGMRTRELGAEEIDVTGTVFERESSSQSDNPQSSSKVSPDFGRFSQQLGAQEMGPDRSIPRKMSGQSRQSGAPFTSDQGQFSPQLRESDIGPSQRMPNNRQDPRDAAGNPVPTDQGGHPFSKFYGKETETSDRGLGATLSDEEASFLSQIDEEDTGLSEAQSTNKMEQVDTADFKVPIDQGETEPGQRGPTDRHEQQGSSGVSAESGFVSQFHGNRIPTLEQQNRPRRPASQSQSGLDGRPPVNNQQQAPRRRAMSASDQSRFPSNPGNEDMGPGQWSQSNIPQQRRQPRGSFTSDQGRFPSRLGDGDIGPKKRAPARINEHVTSDQDGVPWDAPGHGSEWSQSSASVPPPAGKVLTPDHLARDWGTRDGPRPTDLYRGRTQRVASSAAAGKSRWGRMENEKAMFMTNTPAPWETTKAEAPMPERLRDPLSSYGHPNAGMGVPMQGEPLPMDIHDFNNRNSPYPPKKVHRYQPPPHTMMPGNSQSSASTPLRGFSPLVPDSLVREWGMPNARDLYDSRAHNVAAAAAAGKSRWGAMENKRASHTAGTGNMVPRPPDDIFDLRTKDTGGERRITNDQADYYNGGRRTSPRDDHLSQSYQAFAASQADDQFGRADWRHPPFDNVEDFGYGEFPDDESW